MNRNESDFLSSKHLSLRDLIFGAERAITNDFKSRQILVTVQAISWP